MRRCCSTCVSNTAELRGWLDRNLGTVPPQTYTGQAINYLAADWPRLIRYLNDGRVEISNVLCEKTIRPFVVGRKAWLFCDTTAGAHTSARLYSIIETAKANGLEPFAYLRLIFEKLPQATTLADIEALLPWDIAKPTHLRRCPIRSPSSGKRHGRHGRS